MIILKSIGHETIWGGQKLLPYTDLKYKRIGHLYSVIGNKNQSNIILNGSYKGKTLYDYFQHIKIQYMLEEYNEFPVVIALVEAQDNLSIQVHPNDNVAKEIEGKEYGKNESWYFIEPPSDGWIYNGCKCNNKHELISVIKEGNLEKTISHLQIVKGDYVFVEAGTLHSLTKGSFIYEIEENCDLTYRIYDFDRKDESGNFRKLHINEATKAINVEKQSTAFQMKKGLISERKYDLRKIEKVNGYKNSSNNIECFTLLAGEFIEQGEKIVIGSSIILEPDESLDHSIDLAIIAKIKPMKGNV